MKKNTYNFLFILSLIFILSSFNAFALIDITLLNSNGHDLFNYNQASVGAPAIVNQSTFIYADVREYGNFTSIFNSINISIMNPNSLTYAVTNQSMTLISAGRFYYNFTPNVTGNYKVDIILYNGTRPLAGGSTLIYSQEDTATKTVSMMEIIFESFLTVAIGLLLLVIGYYIKNYVLIILSGVWFLGISTQTSFDLWTNGLNAGQLGTFSFFALCSVLLIYQGISMILEERRRAERARVMGDD